MLLLFCAIFSACAKSSSAENPAATEDITTELSANSTDTEKNTGKDLEIEPENLADEAAALSQSPAAIPLEATTVASGKQVKSCDAATIDYSNIEDGYVMVRYDQTTEQKLKAQVKGPSTTYTYTLIPQVWAAFPMSDGNGDYQITVYINVTGNSYAAVVSLSINVTLADEFEPFLRSNQYVNFDDATEAVALAGQLTADLEDPLDKVAAVYDYVVENITYDYELATTVKSGYVPVLDTVLEKKSGICFDYASLMTGMLRSQGIPCKLVVGYAGEVYHAWISVWTEDSGWVDKVIFFDGTSWTRMDPTFASTGNGDESIMEFIGDASNYTAKYFY
jgi:transglutaminase-like putative cysteine protease